LQAVQSEGELIDFIHEAHAKKAVGSHQCGGYSHTSSRCMTLWCGEDSRRRSAHQQHSRRESFVIVPSPPEPRSQRFPASHRRYRLAINGLAPGSAKAKA